MGRNTSSVCTDTITNFWSYCQRLFLSFFYPPLRGLAGGMPAMSRGPVPLDSYRVSHPTDFVKHFFGLFLSFSIFFWLAAEWGIYKDNGGPPTLGAADTRGRRLGDGSRPPTLGAAQRYPLISISSYQHIFISAYQHISISAYHHISISTYLRMCICAYVHINISAYSHINLFEYKPMPLSAYPHIHITT